ncbi:uncharacterized protein JN550_003394 [Neoarthrinium moseri]|uniref:uncharacterized protein n=1 Tax=Neoarthrinium moseri TaxID=1658444 RepID=UPI001FDDB875|nr:uncharacterized protein JN550_003394 [Neoarthrinium moseri]KAI1873141.1 hypothetical protein JN550_003394 [Neoarthrinium moseri]
MLDCRGSPTFDKCCLAMPNFAWSITNLKYLALSMTGYAVVNTMAALASENSPDEVHRSMNDTIWVLHTLGKPVHQLVVESCALADDHDNDGGAYKFHRENEPLPRHDPRHNV